MTPSEIWIEQCEAAREIEDGFGTQRALSYLIGEKFLNFLEAADDDPEFRAECLRSLRRSRRSSSVGNWPSTWRRLGKRSRSIPAIYEDEDPEVIEMERKSELRRSAADLLLVERAKEWLLED